MAARALDKAGAPATVTPVRGAPSTTPPTAAEFVVPVSEESRYAVKQTTQGLRVRLTLTEFLKLHMCDLRTVQLRIEFRKNFL